MVEDWKAIAGYEQHYEISNQGRVRSKDRFIICIDGKTSFRRGKLLKPKKHKAGYFFVQLSDKGKTKNHYIHRLVAQAFIENPENKPQVNHLKCKSCNCVEDLEWVTQKENHQHAFETNLLYKIGRSNLHNKPVRNIITGECWPSIKEAAKAIGRNYTVVRQMLKGKRRNNIFLEYYK